MVNHNVRLPQWPQPLCVARDIHHVHFPTAYPVTREYIAFVPGDFMSPAHSSIPTPGDVDEPGASRGRELRLTLPLDAVVVVGVGSVRGRMSAI